jgi:hypothetical protein
LIISEVSHARIAIIADRLVAVPVGLGLPELAVDLPDALTHLPDPRARQGIRHRLAWC